MNQFMIAILSIFLSCQLIAENSGSQGGGGLFSWGGEKFFSPLEEMFENSSEESASSMETGDKGLATAPSTFELGPRSQSYLQSYDLQDFGFSFDSKMSYRGTNIKGSVIGLANMGNTCYLNSLTVLFAVTKLQDILNSKARIHSTGSEAEVLAKLNLKEAMHSLIMGMNNQVTHGHTERTQRYVKVLGDILASKMEGSLFMQHDPAEMYTHIMDELDSQINGF